MRGRTLKGGPLRGELKSTGMDRQCTVSRVSQRRLQTNRAEEGG